MTERTREQDAAKPDAPVQPDDRTGQGVGGPDASAREAIERATAAVGADEPPGEAPPKERGR
ncbi:hypothetical protein [Methylobacterium sp. A54F]